MTAIQTGDQKEVALISNADQRIVPPSPIQYIPELDGLRGIAILMVIAFHLFQSVPSVINSFPDSIRILSRIGQSGVDLFFVLSGFLITGILLKSKQTSNYFLNFYMRRTLRIFPLYYSTLIMLLIVSLWWNSSDHNASDLWMWTYTSNFPVTFRWGNVTYPHFWSLAVEEQFYLLWPLVVYYLSRRTLIVTSFVIIGGAIITRWLLIEAGYSSFWLLPCRMDSLATGALIAIAVTYSKGLIGYEKIAYTIVFLSGIASGLLFLGTSGQGIAIVQVCKFTLTSCLFGGLIILAASENGPRYFKEFLKSKKLCVVGKYSYAVYVFHPMIIQLSLASKKLAFVNNVQTVVSPLFYDLFFVLFFTILTSWVSWHFLEKHFLELKKYFNYLNKSS